MQAAMARRTVSVLLDEVEDSKTDYLDLVKSGLLLRRRQRRKRVSRPLGIRNLLHRTETRLQWRETQMPELELELGLLPPWLLP
jgi:hypothetical protein